MRDVRQSVCPAVKWDRQIVVCFNEDEECSVGIMSQMDREKERKNAIVSEREGQTEIERGQWRQDKFGGIKKAAI